MQQIEIINPSYFINVDAVTTSAFFEANIRLVVFLSLLWKQCISVMVECVPAMLSLKDGRLLLHSRCREHILPSRTLEFRPQAGYVRTPLEARFEVVYHEERLFFFPRLRLHPHANNTSSLNILLKTMKKARIRARVGSCVLVETPPSIWTGSSRVSGAGLS